MHNKFTIGDKVRLRASEYSPRISELGNPFDEQLGHYGDMETTQIVIEIKDVSMLEGTTGQWIKTDLYCNNFIDALWFGFANDNKLRDKLRQIWANAMQRLSVWHA